MFRGGSAQELSIVGAMINNMILIWNNHTYLQPTNNKSISLVSGGIDAGEGGGALHCNGGIIVILFTRFPSNITLSDCY